MVLAQGLGNEGMRVAPLGVVGAVAYTVGKYGISLVVLYYASLAIFVVVVLGLVMRLVGISIFKFLAYLREELTIVLATASSDAVLPQIMRKLERMGAKKSVVGLVVPTGYSFNLDAFSIYLTLAVVFSLVAAILWPEPTTNASVSPTTRTTVVFPRTTGKKSAKVGAVLLARARPSHEALALRVDAGP